MGASFPPPLIGPGNLAFKRNISVALTNLNTGGAVIANASNAADTTNNTFNSRSVQTVPTNSGGMTDIILKFPGFCQQSGGNPEINIPTPFTVTASLEYPLGTTPRPFYFKGALSGTVNPGPTYLESDPLPWFLNGAFSVRVFGSWTPGSFVFSGGLSSSRPTVDWTNRGTGLADHTLDLTVFSSTTGGVGYCPVIFGTPLIRTPVVGIMGDSISIGASDVADNLTFAPAWQRALLNRIPVLNQGIGGSTMSSWLTRLNGTAQLYLNSITHLLFELGVNDITSGQTLAQMQANFQMLVEPFLARGVKVHACTIMPHASSINNFIDIAGQTIVSAPGEAVRQQWNNYLLTNWQSLGLSGVFDDAKVVDPPNIGKWSADPGITSSSVTTVAQAQFVATLNNGVVSAVNPVITQGGTAWGNSYPPNTTLPWTAQPYNGESGAGASGTVTTNSSGFFAAAPVVNSGGGGYSYPPLICVASPWTLDGLHPSVRGYNQLFSHNGYSPGAFTL